MSNLLRSRSFIFFIMMVWGIAACGTVVAQKGGKGGKGGGGGGEDPPVVELPPVRYQIQFFDLPYPVDIVEIRGTNNSGQAVGRIYHEVDGIATQSAFLYDPQLNPTTAIDLNLIVAGIEEGWKLRNAVSINSSGDIAAYLIKENEPTKTLKAAMIDMSATPPQLHLIPDEGFPSGETHTTDMNDLGDIVARFKREDGTFGAYVYNFGFYNLALKTESPIDLELNVASSWSWLFINNPMLDRELQVVGKLDDGTPFRDTLGGALETFPRFLDESTGNVMELLGPNDINDVGEICGPVRIHYPKKIKGQASEIQLYVMGSSLETFQEVERITSIEKLNESSDFVTERELFQRSWGFLLPSQLLDPTDSDATIWAEAVSVYRLDHINDRDNVTDFPQLFGQATFVDGSIEGFVLSPVPYQ